MYLKNLLDCFQRLVDCVCVGCVENKYYKTAMGFKKKRYIRRYILTGCSKKMLIEATVARTIAFGTSEERHIIALVLIFYPFVV